MSETHAAEIPADQGADEAAGGPRGAAFAWVSLGLSVVSIALPLLAVPAMFGVLLAFVTQRRPAMAVKIALGASTVLMLAAMVRFTVTEAAPGIIEGGRRAQAKSAIYHLRELVFAQDVAREQAFLDPDGDGVGSALSLSALVGQPMRNGEKPRLPLLARFGKVIEHNGVVLSTFQGYGIVVYLPTADGGASAAPGAAYDDEAAERRYLAYAWPLDGGHGDKTVIFVDEHERILTAENTDQQGYVGLDQVPPWWAALREKKVDAAAAHPSTPAADGALWAPWKGKKARANLPGAD